MTCTSDQCAQGAQKALGTNKKIKIIGLSGSKIGVQQVASGAWFADAAPEFPTTMGKQGAQALLDALSGKTPQSYIDVTKTLKQPEIIYATEAKNFPYEWTGN